MSKKFPLFNQPEILAVVQKICDDHGIKFPEFEELVHAEIQQLGKGRKRGLYDQFNDILDRITHEEN